MQFISMRKFSDEFSVVLCARDVDGFGIYFYKIGDKWFDDGSVMDQLSNDQMVQVLNDDTEEELREDLEVDEVIDNELISSLERFVSEFTSP